MNKTILTSGKRKTSTARVTLNKGVGKIKINNVPLEIYEPKIYRMRIEEPLVLSGDIRQSVDISVNVSGGGSMSQSDASRTAIARALVEHSPKLKQIFSEYDRHLLVADVRLKETHKPNKHGAARSKKQKSYR
ncbi:MAG: 30S ribosomal protein S9 [Nanoarchaeota archaeon]